MKVSQFMPERYIAALSDVFLFISNDQLLFQAVHDCVVSFHEVLVVKKRSLYVIQVHLVLELIEVGAAYDAHGVDDPTAALCTVKVPDTVRDR